SGRPAHTANDARKIQVRKVNACPALMRFFQRNATAQTPVGRSVNGGDLRFFGWAAECQTPPARTAATRSANLRDTSTEASSSATTESTTMRRRQFDTPSSSSRVRANDAASVCRLSVERTSHQPAAWIQALPPWPNRPLTRVRKKVVNRIAICERNSLK